MISGFRAYIEIVKTSFTSRMAYRGDFWISAVMTIAGELVVPLVTFLIYRSGASFPGWSLSEALLIQAIFLLSKGIAFPFFFGIVWNTLDRVREGTFDLLLIKPRPALWMALVTGFQPDGLGRLLGGIALTGAAVRLVPQAGAADWLLFAVLMLFSIMVLFAFALFMSGILFRWVGSSRVYEMFDSVASFGQYPRTIFAKSFVGLVLQAVPVLMIGYFPAAALLGKLSADVWIAAAVSFVFFLLSLVFWHRMLGNYTSAGG
ncbi:ABC transporter permease [Paenibacillus ginsengarvi]|uniref:Multidrug ABC transporter permease n=1 Tax=Paenibacillus ginsengarvi TaxID=400777 RepID=A0A3B0C8B9_9BACL|nr:ABC-2 family transporter protein [Paenibacillus ginsengarvi]RKN80698.1 multidrug ABC transporter permease [Paenibacillus ginsengarvi]